MIFFFQTGADEHGQKIEEKAKVEGVSPQEYVDNVVSVIKQIWDLMNISYDNFIRTTNDYHKKQVQNIFKLFYDQGDIYKGQYEGWYCTPCESFLTESQLVDGKCPDCGRMVNKAKEDAYFFRMSKYADFLNNFYDSHSEFIVPQSRKREMENTFLKPGLQDLCVSRSSFKWGIPIDFDSNHVVYVWLDALTNYITGLGYDVNGKHAKNFKYWPANLYVVGKDIVRFHAIYWPIFLKALNLPLPKTILGHGWLLQDGGKMSKSQGNVIYPDDLVKHFGVDAVRYYVLSEMPQKNDGSITWESIIDKTNNDLANVFGNLISRTVAMCTKYFDGIIVDKCVSESVDEDFKLSVTNAYKQISTHMDEFQISDALSHVMSIFRRANKYIDETQLWILAKSEETKDRLSTVLYNLSESIIIGLSLMYPFMPNTCKEALRFFGRDSLR